MKNLLDTACRQEILDRLGRLSPESSRLFGRMDVGQMLCHLADPMRVAFGEIQAVDASNLFTRTFLRWMVLSGAPTPKGKVETFPELDHAKGGGTQPTDFASDLEALRAMISRFVEHASAGKSFAPSPVFGELSGRAYGRLMYVHMCHHLEQFGV